MSKNLFSIWKIALFGGLLAFSALLWLNSHVGYQAKSAVLVKGISNNKATADDTVAKTIASFATTDTYRERTLSSTRLQESKVGQIEITEQDPLIKNVEVMGGKQGGLITVTATYSDAEIAEVVSKESTETLVRMARLYVGGPEELSLIIIDQPIVSKAVVAPLSYVVKVIVSTVVLFFILVLAQPLLSRIKREVKGRALVEKEEEPFVPTADEERDERFVPQKLDPTFLYPEREVNTETLPVFGQPKASDILKGEVYGEAPKNDLQSVSVSMDDLPFSFETPDVEMDDMPEVDPEEMYPLENIEHQNTSPEREPTVVEYKQRLNELLSQK